MTPAQRAAVLAAINADPAAAALRAANDDEGLAAWLNADASPAVVVWRTSVSAQEMQAAYVWTEMDTLTQARFNALTLMLQGGTLNPSMANVRQGLADIFAGATLATTRAALLALAKRNASRFERILATGAGTSASPATLAEPGPIAAAQVSTIIR